MLGTGTAVTKFLWHQHQGWPGRERVEGRREWGRHQWAGDMSRGGEEGRSEGGDEQSKRVGVEGWRRRGEGEAWIECEGAPSATLRHGPKVGKVEQPN